MRGLGALSQRLVRTAAMNPNTYGHLVTECRVPADSVLMKVNNKKSLFGQGYFKLAVDNTQLDLHEREVEVTPWAYNYLRYQGYESKAKPGEGDGPSRERFPPDLALVLDSHYNRTQIQHPGMFGRMLKVSGVMATLRQQYPDYNLKKRSFYRKKIIKLLEGYCR